MLIVLEGIDGSGKTTQARLLHDYFKRQGTNVVVTSEPTDGPVGKLIEALLSKNHDFNEEWGRIMALLFAADRYYHSIKIKEWLSDNYVVISDRYYHSTFAYQMLYDNISIEWLKELHKYLPRPDVTFIIDVDPREAIRRVESRGKEQKLYEKLEYLKRVRENYLRLPEILPNERIEIIDGESSIEGVFRQIISRL